MSPIKYCNDHPWIYVVLAFAILIAAWTTIIIIAVKNRPAPLPEQTTSFNRSSASLPISHLPSPARSAFPQ